MVDKISLELELICDSIISDNSSGIALVDDTLMTGQQKSWLVQQGFWSFVCFKDVPIWSDPQMKAVV